MLNKEDLLLKMKDHFPRWMDIKKRTEKSNGGKYLMSISEEVAEIQSAIDDYKKDFFFTSYDGKEEEIVDFVYKMHIGDIEDKELEIIKPLVKVTKDIKEFYSKLGLAYYEDGSLYFRVEDIKINYDLNLETPVVNYRLDKYRSTSFIEKQHVWNVYDEFATFLGIKRHQGENNKELSNRIIATPRRNTNSTDQGLKNAILNELRNIDEDLTYEDIKIESPTPENLIKYYDDFQMVIDKMAEVNRDVYKTKRWELDSWSYGFKTIDYIPHMWDMAINTFKNGIGDNDDLKVSLTSEYDKTDVDITLYKESEQKISNYIKDRNIKKDINLQLTKYDNILNPISSKYKITASEAKELTGENITLEAFDKSYKNEKRNIEELILDTKQIEVIENNILKANRDYKVLIEPLSDYSPILVKKCSVTTTDSEGGVEEVNLLKNKLGFRIDSHGSLVDNYTKLYAKKKRDFSSSYNAIDVAEGIKINDLSKDADIILNLNGLSNEYIKIDHSIPLSPILDGHINKGSCKSENGEITIGENQFVEINIKANEVNLDIISSRLSSYSVVTEIDGKRYNDMDIVSKSFTTKDLSGELEKPKNIYIKIFTNGKEDIKISNLEYSSYEFNIGLEKGDFRYFENKIQLPSESSNQLFINIKTNTGHSPLLKFIHIGRPLSNLKYETDVIASEVDKIKRLLIDTECKIKVIDVKTGTEYRDYSKFSSYKSIGDESYIKLDLINYTKVNNVKTDIGTIEMTGSGGTLNYYLKLKRGESVSSISVDGERLIRTSHMTLIDLLKIDILKVDKLYGSKLLKGFIKVDKDDNQSLIQIHQSDLSDYISETYVVKGLADDTECAFVMSNKENSVEITNSYTGNFDILYIYPRANKTYIAFNDRKVIQKEVSDIDIVDVFNPFLPKNKLLAYKVEAMNKDSEVKFDKKLKDFIELKDWNLGRAKLRIRTGIDLSNNNNYIKSHLTLSKDFVLRNTISLDRYYKEDSLTDLCEYIVEAPRGMELVYKQKPSSGSLETSPEFYSVETIIPEEDGFNKLRYSNIDEIIYMSTSPWDGMTYTGKIDGFNLMNKEGILLNSNTSYEKLFIVYTYKIPYYIKIDIEELYKTIDYNIDAYKSILDLSYTKEDVGFEENLLKSYPNEFKESSRVVVSNLSPGYRANLKDGIVTLERTNEGEDVIALKTGYYYLDGDEYFLFANETEDIVDKTKNVEFNNVNREEGEMILKKSSNNFITNSYMRLEGLSDIFNINFEENKVIKGVSLLNSITACNSFNYWRTFGSKLSFSKGHNGLGIRLTPTIKNGYAYIDITKQLLKNTSISLYKTEGLKVLIGKEYKYKDIVDNKVEEVGIEDSNSIRIEDKQFEQSLFNKEMHTMNLTPQENYRYFLIVSGSGVIDDIILRDADDDLDNIHYKNIDKLNLAVDEKISDVYDCRLFLDNNQGIQSEGLEISKDGYLTNSSVINWGLTRLKSFKKGSWDKFELQNVVIDSDFMRATSVKEGTIITEPIHIGNKNLIKDIIIKINDVMFDNMTGFTTSILTSNSFNGSYSPVSYFLLKDNLGSVSGEHLSQYIKLVIELPKDKVISSIELYAEHKTTQTDAPAEIPFDNGTLKTEVLDTYYQQNYTVKDIEIEDISNIKDVDILIRAAREDYDNEVWTSWKPIELDKDMNITNKIIFKNYRFFQCKVVLKNKEAFIKLKHIDIEGENTYAAVE